jgi:hypothetical protein
MQNLNKPKMFDSDIGAIDIIARDTPDAEFERQYEAHKRVAEALRITGRTGMASALPASNMQ